ANERYAAQFPLGRLQAHAARGLALLTCIETGRRADRTDRRIAAVAITFGAPFWFDTLSKLARLRNSGAPPPASDAVRRGEGEETRRGESAAVATPILEATGQSAETQPAG